ncbi:MAG: hypothetical protein AB8B64_06010 [Granulosicoccus sp.]
MPHINIEYSANIEVHTDISALCDVLRQAAADIEAFPMPGLRVRAFRADHYSIADGNPKHGFIDISVRLRAGRALAIKKDAVQILFDAARGFLEPVMAQHSLALSLEMRDIDPELSPKIGTVRDHL